MSAAPDSGGLFRDRDFLLFMSGQGASALGDAVSQTALPLLVLHLTGSGTQMGLVAMLQALPMLILGLPAGALADRWDRRRTMLWCDIGRAALIALVPLSAWIGLPALHVLYAIVVPLGVLFTLFEAACLSCVPALVGRERLARANGYLSISNSVGFIVGPALAGVLTRRIGGAATLAVDAVSFAISALTLGLIRRPLQQGRADRPQRLRAEVLVGLRFVAAHPVLRRLLLLFGLIGCLTAPLVACAAFYLTRDLGRSEDLVGLAISAYAIGAILGALAGGLLERHTSRAMPLGLAVGGAATLALGSVGALGGIVALALIAGAAESMAAILYVTLRASVTPDHLLGRVTTTARVMTFALQPLGFLLGGLLLDRIGGGATLAIIGGATAILGLGAGLSHNLRAGSLRHARVETTPVVEVNHDERHTAIR
jgi:MFS family permease